MTPKKLAILLCITFVLLSTVYLGAVTLGGGPIEPVIFLALAGILGCPLVVKLLAPDLTGRLRGRGRVPFELEDPGSQRRTREEPPSAPADTPDRRHR